jgi:DNA-directed RNA polymerase alpha subunit
LADRDRHIHPLNGVDHAEGEKPKAFYGETIVGATLRAIEESLQRFSIDQSAHMNGLKSLGDALDNKILRVIEQNDKVIELLTKQLEAVKEQLALDKERDQQQKALPLFDKSAPAAEPAPAPPGTPLSVLGLSTRAAKVVSKLQPPVTTCEQLARVSPYKISCVENCGVDTLKTITEKLVLLKFRDPKEPIPPPIVRPGVDLDANITTLEWNGNIRAQHSLVNAKILTLRQVVYMHDLELLAVPKFGEGGLIDLKAGLARLGLQTASDRMYLG